MPPAVIFVPILIKGRPMKRIVGLLLGFLAHGAFACTINIIYSDVSAPPYLIGDGEVVPAAPGIAIELANEAAARINCKINWRRMPNRRVQFEMEGGRADAMLMYSFSRERANYAVYPTKDGNPDANYRLAELSYYVYVKDGSPLLWDGKQFTGSADAIGVNSGYSAGADLRKLGVTVEEARSTEQNFIKLRLGRIAAYVMQDFPADLVIAEKNFTDVHKLPIPFSTKDYYLPFSQKFYSTSPTTATRLWEQIGKTAQSRRKELLKKYSETPYHLSLQATP